MHGVRSKQILDLNQPGLTNIAFYSQELSKELPRDFLKVHALNLKSENKMYEQNKNISIQTIGRSFFCHKCENNYRRNKKQWWI